MIRENLRAARGVRSQCEVSKDIGITQKYLSKLELGHGVPSAKLIYKLTCYYKLEAKDLFPDIFLGITTT